jgi:ammonia channel protein AmtB
VLQLKAGIDDPLDSAPVHAINGILGMLMTSFMAKPAHVALVVGEGGCGGIFYTKDGWMQLATQVLGKATTGQLCPAHVCACADTPYILCFKPLLCRGVVQGGRMS